MTAAAQTLGLRHVVAAFVRLRWRLLRASARGKGSARVGVILSTAGSAIVGTLVGLVCAVAGRRADDPSSLFVVACTLVTLGVAGVSTIAGITQPIDPRVIATEPLTDRERAVGLLAATASGPPGLAGGLVGVGLLVGSTRAVGATPSHLVAVLGVLLLLLVTSRLTANTLGLVATRFPRLGQLVVAIGGLVVYGSLQFVPQAIAGLDRDERARLADVMAWTPPGQLGRALGTDGAAAWAHLAAGLAGTIPITVLAIVSTRALAETVRRTAGTRHVPRRSNRAGALARAACGRGPQGAVAWRGLLVRFRTPRTAVETFTGAGVGMAVVLVPTLVRDDLGAGAVLVGGAVQLAVVFMAGNTLGNTGPALTWEVLTGAPPRVLAAGTARSIAIAAAPLALVGPLVVAAVSGQWMYLPAGIIVGASGVLAGTGGALAQSTLVPIAVPESDNPLATGESGRGVVAALLLGAVLLGLALVTLPVGLALAWADARGSTSLVTGLALASLAAGAIVFRLGVRVCTRRLHRDAPGLLAAITPAR